MSFFHKKKASTKANAANVHMTEAEAALAQSDFNIDKILEIQNKFTGGTALLVPGRIFIREGMLWKICRKGPKKRQFFLFNDILVYGSVVAGRYSNQHILPLAHMAVSGDPSYQPEVNATFNIESLDEQLDIHNAFQISHADKSFHVFSLSQADKANWLANLQKHINKVALVGGNQTVAPRAVWVPDSQSKECMICGQRFSAFNRKHHCRQCGRVVCSSCSPHRVIIDPQTDNKPERGCSECVKEVSPVKSKGSPELHAKAPPAAVAAQMVSNALRHNSDHQPARPSDQSPRHRRDSTDTEDSDDSEREEDSPPTKKKPTPTPRRTQSELSKNSPSSGPPQRPPPFGSVRRPPPPPIPDPQRTPSPSPLKEYPKPKPRTKAPPDQSSLTPPNGVAEGVRVGESEGVRVGESEGVRVGESEGVQVPSDEPQPTPPPRKRKKAKLKAQIEQQLKQQVEDHTPPTAPPTDETSVGGEKEEFGDGEQDTAESDAREAERDEFVEVIRPIEEEEEEEKDGEVVVLEVKGEIEVGEVVEVAADEEVGRVCGDSGDGEQCEDGDIKRPRRRKKHFSSGEEQAEDEDNPTTTEPTSEEGLDEATPTDSAHQEREATPTDDITPESSADQDTNSETKEVSETGTETGTGTETETETETGTEIGTETSGQEHDSGQESGPPSLPSETAEGEIPVKKPRGRRQKFKQAES